MADSDQERTLPASQRRIEQARADGNVPRSRELVSASVLLAAMLTWSFTGTWFGGQSLGLMRHGLQFERIDVFDHQRMLVWLAEVTAQGLILALVIGCLCFFAAVVANLAVGGLNYAPEALGFKLNRLDPMAGLGRLLNLDSLIELLKGLLKAIVLGLIVAKLLMAQAGEMASLSLMAGVAGVPATIDLIRRDLYWILLPIFVIVALDVPWVLWRYYDRLKMTLEEAKQESKETDGDPHVKARIRGLQRQAARKRMMEAVPKADVVVTNPTHYSVALRYQEASAGGVPRVVAKGKGEVALKIRELAQQHAVPVLSAPPLARALFRHVKIDAAIPGQLYTAVALVLAYVYQLRSWRSHGGPVPVAPTALPVPDDMDIPPDQRVDDDDDGAAEVA